MDKNPYRAPKEREEENPVAGPPPFELEEQPRLDQRARRRAVGYSYAILNDCVRIPSLYWPQLVNTACQKLLDAGETEAFVRCVYRKVARELTLT